MAHNPTVDFVFIGDSPAQGPLPTNVFWMHKPLSELLRLVGEELGCALPWTTPYKLCDLKPAFGLAFSSLLEDYDFWGHIDCDTILGDLRAVATQELLIEHDVLSFKGRNFVHGPLTLWRNTEHVNRLFMRADWKRIFQHRRYLGFDETALRWGPDRHPCSVQKREERGQIPCITDIVQEAAKSGEISFYDHEHMADTKPRHHNLPLALIWKQGRMRKSMTRRPAMYYHIHWAKTDVERGDPPFIIPNWKWYELPERFTITREGVGLSRSCFNAARLKQVRYMVATGWKDLLFRARCAFGSLLRRIGLRRISPPAPVELYDDADEIAQQAEELVVR